MIILQITGAILVILGLVFFLGAAVGVVRFPDFYSRMHAAGKGDTLSTILMLLGIVCFLIADVPWAAVIHGDFSLLVEPILTSIKVLMIALLIMVTSPTSTHALMQAGYDSGIKPHLSEADDDSTPSDEETPTP